MVSKPAVLISSIMETLRRGFLDGANRTYADRIRNIESLLSAVLAHMSEIHEAVNKDLGRSPFMTDLTETEGIKDTVGYYKSNLRRFMSEIPKDIPALFLPGKIYLRPEPYGLALVLGTWNFPFGTSIDPVINAIAAGNVVLLKPSELAPHSSAVMKKIFSGLDSRVFACLEGGAETAIALLEERWDLIVFTGSPQKGKLIAAAAAKHLTPVVLELGGKCPVVVDKDADMRNAALRITQGRYLNSGQVCISPDMAIVHKSRLDEFLSSMKATIRQFFGEDPKRSKDYSRMVNEFHTKRVASLLEGHGGEVVCGGEVDVAERYIAPTIILSPSRESPVGSEEIFGPVLVVFSYENLEEVFTVVNSMEKPLALYYFGSNRTNFEALKLRTSSGNITWNDTVFHHVCSDLPFGGVGNSGSGFMYGEEGFRSMSHSKSVMERSDLNFGPLNLRYPPYTDANQRKFMSTKNRMNFNASSLAKFGKRVAVLIIVLVLAYKGYLKVPLAYLNQLKELIKRFWR